MKENVCPLISVIIPNYNHAKFLDIRIDSILNQTFRDFELIILDDASTDNSTEIIEKYSNHPQISSIMLNEKNSGSPFVQWAKGINVARGEYIWIAESDDSADVEFLEKILEMSKGKSSLSLIFTNSVLMDLNLNTTRIAVSEKATGIYNANEINFFYNWFFLNSEFRILNASSCLFRRNLVNSEILGRISKQRYSGDKYFWVLLLNQNPIFGYLDKSHNIHTTHAQTTRSHTSRSARFQRAKELLEIYSACGFVNGDKYDSRLINEIGLRILTYSILGVYFERRFRFFMILKGLGMIDWNRKMAGKFYRNILVN